MSAISVPSSLSGSTDTSRTATPAPMPTPPPQRPFALTRSGFDAWKAYLSSKPRLWTISFAISAVIGLIHYLRMRRRSRTAPRIPASAVPMGMREEVLTHLASIDGQLAGSSDKSVVDEIKWRLTTGREQRRAGLLGGLWNEAKRAIGIQYRWLTKA